MLDPEGRKSQREQKEENKQKKKSLTVTHSCLRLHGLQHQLPFLGILLVLNNLVFVAMGRLFEALFLSLSKEKRSQRENSKENRKKREGLTDSSFVWGVDFSDFLGLEKEMGRRCDTKATRNKRLTWEKSHPMRHPC